MISVDDQGIGYTDFLKIFKNQPEFFNFFLKTKIDFIIDCSKVIASRKFIEKVLSHQNDVKKCLVIIIPFDKNKKLNEKWNIVPTKTEAFDFISLEQIQRKLGF